MVESKDVVVELLGPARIHAGLKEGATLQGRERLALLDAKIC